jgi:hypothetical protein
MPATPDQFKPAARWIRREIARRVTSAHPSHVASRVLEEADAKFALGSFGVEGWAKSPNLGYQYLNFGDSYAPTIVIRSNAITAMVFVAMGGYAAYA